MDDMFAWQKRIMKRMEEFNLEHADAVTGLDSYMLENIKFNFPELDINTFEVLHGYDPHDFSEGKDHSVLNYKEEKLYFLYSGLFYEQNQSDMFLKAIKSAESSGLVNGENIHLHFQGGLDQRIHKQVKSSKLFEYFGTGKPILGLVYDGESSKLLKEYTAGFFGNLDDNESITEQICSIYQKWELEDLPRSSKEFMERFDRREITKNLAQILTKFHPNNILVLFNLQ
ncbi:MAG TPA: hypothetical protein VFM80_02770 [Gracilimonas sp.]|uniref:hypothetical protein n=1 Tax=Gracilimonas sp. TaxID=1974203 RepID=UPI002D8192DF|nr:hypothetical protein [Gracilimonas sp.]